MKIKKLKKGFTLVELVVVIAVIAVLAAVSVGAYFGVTDSAKASNATSSLKQAKDYYMLYVVDQDTDLTLQGKQKGDDFAIRYISNIGGNIDLNFALVKTDDNKDATLYKVETEYPTWFLVLDDQIIDEGTVSKNNEDFLASINQSKYLTTLDTSTLTFSISTVKLSNGTTVRGYRYSQVTIDSDKSGEEDIVDYVLNGNSLVDTKITYAITSTDSTTIDGTNLLYGPDFEYKVGDEVFDENAKFDLDDKINAIKSIEEYDYSYVVDELLINKNYINYDVSFERYPVLLRTYEKDANNNVSPINYYRRNFTELKSLMDSLTLNNHAYIFPVNAMLDIDFTIPSNYTLVVDYQDDLTKFIEAYPDSSKYSTLNKDNNLRAIRVGSSLNDFVSTENLSFDPIQNSYTYTKPSVDDASNVFTIKDGVTLTVNPNSHLLVEGIVNLANGGRSGSIGAHAVIVNNGRIEMSSGSLLRTTGKILGKDEINKINGIEQSVINLQTGSKMIDILKPLSWSGGSFFLTEFLGFPVNSENLGNAISAITGKLQSALDGGFAPNIFPMPEYLIDNNQCKIYINYGSSYDCLTGIEILEETKIFTIPLISSNNKAVVNVSEGGLISKHNINEKIKLTLLSGTFNFSGIEFDMSTSYSGISINIVLRSNAFSFPFSHVDLLIEQGVIINLSKSGSRPLEIEFRPTSSVVNNGIINVKDGASLAFMDFNEEHFNNYYKDSNGNPVSINYVTDPLYKYECVYKLNSSNVFVVNNGTINVDNNYTTIVISQKMNSKYYGTYYETVNDKTYNKYSGVYSTGAIEGNSIISTSTNFDSYKCKIVSSLSKTNEKQYGLTGIYKCFIEPSYHFIAIPKI